MLHCTSINILVCINLTHIELYITYNPANFQPVRCTSETEIGSHVLQVDLIMTMTLLHNNTHLMNSNHPFSSLIEYFFIIVFKEISLSVA